jgi:ribosomal-protein-alanine N-acetyltransferase
MEPSFDFGQFPLLASERLELCAFDPKYVDDIFVIRGDPEVQLYNSEPHQTRDDTLRFIQEQLEKYERRQEITWGLQLRVSGRVVGGVSMFDWDRYHRRASIGYDLARDCWGRGLAQEAIREVLRFGFERMALHRIEIWTSEANLRSQRLAERIGFTRDGTLRERILEDDGQFYGCAIFGLLHSDWLAAH